MNAQVHRRKSINLETHKQTIYDHLIDCAKTEAAAQVLKRFHSLFISGTHYPVAAVKAALNQLVTSMPSKDEFSLFFNRCCYILVNRWQTQFESREAITELVTLLGRMSATPATLGRSRSSTRLRSLVQQFAQSSYYQRLRRFAEFINPHGGSAANKPLGTILKRYPYLYQHCLVSQEDSKEHQSTILQAQQRAQDKFELDLSHYLAGVLKRPSEIRQQLIVPAQQTQLILPTSVRTGSLIQPATALANPTLLQDSDLCGTLKHFVGKVNRQGTYQDMATHFKIRNQSTQTYATFKSNFYQYLAASVDPKFGRSRFNSLLKRHFDDLFPDCNQRPMTEFLMVRTCNRLLNFLIVESRKEPRHMIFMDLINNIGSTQTIGLLLKVVLLCKKIKPYLENRFALLFNHYESQRQGSVTWLVGCLEKLQLAFSTHFSRFDFSFITAL